MNKNYYMLSFVVSIINATMIAISYLSLPQQVPMWLTYPWGESQLAPKTWLAILPAAGLAVNFVNQFIARLLTDKSKLMNEMLGISALLVNVMLFVSIFGIVQSLL